MVRYATVAQWRAEAVRRFGERTENWAFVCPSCGMSATIGDMIRAGGTANDAPQECISLYRYDTGDCGCRAYREGTQGRGALIGADGEDLIEVFDFAPALEAAQDIARGA